MKQILLLSRVNTKNLGDQMIGRTMLSLFSPYGHVVQGDICASKCDKIINYGDDVNYLPIKSGNIKDGIWSKIKQLLKGCLDSSFIKNQIWLRNNYSIFYVLFKKKYDLIVIGGGELINPSFAFALKIWSMFIRLFQQKAEVVLFGVGVSDCKDKKKRQQLSSIVKLASKIFVRDELSKMNMSELYDKQSIEIPDVVYNNDFSGIKEKQYSLYGLTSFERIKNHNMTYSSEKDYFDASYDDLCGIAQIEKVRLLYTSQEDYDACIKFVVYCKECHDCQIEMAQIKTLDDLIGTIQGSKNVWSPRMHGCIIAQLCGAEVHPILISKKMNSYKSKYLQCFDLAAARETLNNTVKSIIL